MRNVCCCPHIRTKKRIKRVIQVQMKPIIRFLTLLALFSAPHLASAYYDPGVQRWISRDPVGERGFQAARQSKRSTGRNELNLFLFVGNTPNHDIDAYGLQRVDPDTSIDECLSNCASIAESVGWWTVPT